MLVTFGRLYITRLRIRPARRCAMKHPSKMRPDAESADILEAIAIEEHITADNCQVPADVMILAVNVDWE